MAQKRPGRALGIVEQGVVRVKIVPAMSAIGRPGTGD
jgi:hypothetical protein